MYTCTVCIKTFKRREHIRYHNFCATGDKPFKCDLCGQSFASKSHFECHHLNHTGLSVLQFLFLCERLDMIPDLMQNYDPICKNSMWLADYEV
jgi:uncharacterized Zn-finger protein